MIGYCVKCKRNREMKNTRNTITKNKRKVVKGTCPICGTSMARFVR